MSSRPPPHDFDAEAAVISASMLGQLAADIAVGMLPAEAFFSRVNQLVFAAITEMVGEKSPVDVVTVGARLRAKDQIGEVGSDYLADIADGTPFVANVEKHAEIVLECFRMRRVIELGHRIVGEGYGDVGPRAEWIADKERELFELSSQTAQDEDEHINPILKRAFEAIDAHSRSGRAIMGATSGLRDLDLYTGGLVPGELWVVAGRPGMGKTAFAAHIASAIASDGKAAQVNSLEMPKEQWALRLPCTLGQVDSLAVRRNKLDEQGWSKLTGAMTEVLQLPIYINDKSGITIEAIRGAVRRRQARLKMEGKELGVLLVDYLQLCDGRGAGKNAIREQQVAHISMNLKRIAKDCRIPVVALSQLNRSVETRENKRPGLSDLRESGSIEQDADVIVFLYRHEYYYPECSDAQKNVVEVNVAKARSGETGTVLSSFTPKFTRFGDLHIDAQREYQAANETPQRSVRRAS